MPIRILTTICFFLIANFNLSSQNYFTVGAGITGYDGDIPSLNTNSVLKSEKGLSLSISYRKAFSPLVSAKVAFEYLTIKGNDNIASREVIQQRNLRFETSIIDGEIGLIIYPLKPIANINTYFGLGISTFFYNPTTDLNGTKYNLRDYGTEGQLIGTSNTKSYSNFGYSLPITIGHEFPIGNNSSIYLELKYRITQSDYLDDVSSIYRDPEDLLTSNSLDPNITLQLADRSGEISPDLLHTPGSQRGNPDLNDRFLSLTLGFKTPINIDLKKNKLSCPTF